MGINKVPTPALPTIPLTGKQIGRGKFQGEMYISYLFLDLIIFRITRGIPFPKPREGQPACRRQGEGTRTIKQNRSVSKHSHNPVNVIGRITGGYTINSSTYSVLLIQYSI
jgi:hypothetical protein